MKLIVLIFSVLIYVCVVEALSKCSSGGKIYENGISKTGRQQILKEHNKYRKQVSKGLVPKQPKGKSIAVMSYDRNLEKLAKKVSKTCTSKHVKVTDKRWPFVGQSLYTSWSSVNKPGQNWTEAANAWFLEYKLYKYPNSPTKLTGHYTQMIWSTSTKLGCDFIQFYDKSKPKYPYAKLYTCNYGPGGNINSRAPYPKYK